MVQLREPSPESLDDARLRDSLAAVDDIRECYRVLEKAGLNVVGEVPKGQGAFYEVDHYPEDDVYDTETASQYYYHAHREDHPEHGHFHLFVRHDALPGAFEPVLGPTGSERVVHLVAVSMDSWGYPTDLFTVNRWVTDESWLPAVEVISVLERFKIDHAYPSWPVNRWLTAMMRCFRPQVEALLRHRDMVVSRRNEGDLKRVLEDRSLETIGSVAIDVDQWAGALEAERERRRAGAGGVSAPGEDLVDRVQG